ncbi:hypothetical protein J5X84_02335 [Streptosporangiaceae bacterium NEAU-GS5]|nr:hypothetical protein [Streptosporangiaceae bacterium NEAU-GS5]
MMDQVTWVITHPIHSAVIATAALVGLVVVLRVLKKLSQAVKTVLGHADVDTLLTYVVAGMASAVAGTGMWKFFGRALADVDPMLRIALFAFIELSVIISAVRARKVLRESIKRYEADPDGAPLPSSGLDGKAVWALTALSGGLACLETDSFPEAVLRLAAPLVAAWLWERGMSIERQRARKARRIINWRLTPERVLVRLGVAEATGRDVTEVEAHRRVTKVALAAGRARMLAEAKPRILPVVRTRMAQRRLNKAMRGAVEYADLVTSRTAHRMLLGQIGALHGAVRLAELTPPAPWEAPTPVDAAAIPARVRSLPDRAEVDRAVTRPDRAVRITGHRTVDADRTLAPHGADPAARTAGPAEQAAFRAQAVDELRSEFLAAVEGGHKFTLTWRDVAERYGRGQRWSEGALADAKRVLTPAPDDRTGAEPGPDHRTDTGRTVPHEPHSNRTLSAPDGDRAVADDRTISSRDGSAGSLNVA